MDLNDIINQCNQQYDEVDSKKESISKEEKIDIDDVLKLNEVTEKWLEEEREYQENVKEDKHSKAAFTKRTDNYSYKKEEPKEEKKSSYYGSYYGKEEKKSGYSSYSSSYSSSSSSKKTSDEIFYERVEKAFDDKINKMVEEVLNKQLNKIEDDFEWDILDMQYELNKKRLAKRDYEDNPQAKEFIKNVEKASIKCARKVDMAELLLVLKINPYK